MPYIGTQPLTGQFKKLDAISVVNGQAAYTLNHNGAAYKPATANALLVSVNGVIQAAGDAYTISGSTITFTENLVTGDVIDFIIALGDTGSAVTPVDGSVTTAKLGDDSVSTAKIANSAVDLTSKVTGTLPVANGGTGLTSGFFNGISHLDIWHMDTAENIGTSGEFLAHWSSMNGDKNFSRIGTAMTVTSQTYFTFPVTGTWRVVSNLAIHVGEDNRYFQHEIRLSTDSGSNFDQYDVYNQIAYLSSGTSYSQSYRERFINVTDASTFRVGISCNAAANVTVQGNNTTSKHLSRLTFMRIGDAQ